MQKHVHELRKKLEGVFGSDPDSDDNDSSTQLYDQIKKLNQTIQDAYNAVLQNSLGML